MGRLVLALSCVALAVAASSLAAEKQDELVIRSTSRLVQMSVVAQDKQGHPVADLEKEDFEVFDNGKPCPIKVFVVEAPGSSTQPRPLPRSTFTNQFARTTGARSGYAVILLDWLNTAWADQARARKQVVQMLQRIELNDKVALYVLDRGLRVVTDFGVDKATLLEKLAALRGDPRDLLEVQTPAIADASVSGSGPLAADFSKLTGQGMPAANVSAPVPGMVPPSGHIATGEPQTALRKDEQVFFLDRRVHDTLLAFEEIANHLANVPGRKILIWVSAGSP